MKADQPLAGKLIQEYRWSSDIKRATKVTVNGLSSWNIMIEYIHDYMTQSASLTCRLSVDSPVFLMSGKHTIIILKFLESVRMPQNKKLKELSGTKS